MIVRHLKGLLVCIDTCQSTVGQNIRGIGVIQQLALFPFVTSGRKFESRKALVFFSCVPFVFTLVFAWHNVCFHNSVALGPDMCMHTESASTLCVAILLLLLLLLLLPPPLLPLLLLLPACLPACLLLLLLRLLLLPAAAASSAAAAAASAAAAAAAVACLPAAAAATPLAAAAACCCCCCLLLLPVIIHLRPEVYFTQTEVLAVSPFSLRTIILNLIVHPLAAVQCGLGLYLH